MPDSMEKNKPHKFLFDLNIFDDDYIEEPEEPEEPPPPTFSEEELEAARMDGYRRGREDATREQKESREQFIAAQLEVVASTLPQIFREEDFREKRYEEEVIKLAHCMMRKLFPIYNERYGFEEMAGVIGKVLSSQEGKAAVRIEVSADTAAELEEHLKATISADGRSRVEIMPVKDAGPGSCRVAWEDGGAVRDAGLLAAKIEAGLEQLLAARGCKLGYSGQDDDVPAKGDDTKVELKSIPLPDDGDEKR